MSRRCRSEQGETVASDWRSPSRHQSFIEAGGDRLTYRSRGLLRRRRLSGGGVIVPVGAFDCIRRAAREEEERHEESIRQRTWLANGKVKV